MVESGRSPAAAKLNEDQFIHAGAVIDVVRGHDDDCVGKDGRAVCRGENFRFQWRFSKQPCVVSRSGSIASTYSRWIVVGDLFPSNKTLTLLT
jgi:hypothetical protein